MRRISVVLDTQFGDVDASSSGDFDSPKTKRLHNENDLLNRGGFEGRFYTVRCLLLSRSCRSVVD
jgi:hypothetical protein